MKMNNVWCDLTDVWSETKATPAALILIPCIQMFSGLTCPVIISFSFEIEFAADDNTLYVGLTFTAVQVILQQVNSLMDKAMSNIHER